jgi:hypothetical protein
MSVEATEVAMDPDTLAALRGSIAKWRGIMAGTTEDLGPENCPLCRKFNRWYLGMSQPAVVGVCEGCPVAVRTGEDSCSGSPYDDYEAATQYIEECGDSEKPQVAVRIGNLARLELEFLISLLPAGEVR